MQTRPLFLLDMSRGEDWLKDEVGWTFENRQRKVRFDERRVKAFIDLAWRDLASEWDFGVVVSNDRAVRNANRKYRNEAKATDVLSFPTGEGMPYTRPWGYLGDLMISATRAADQAQRYQHSVTDEVKVLVLHGLLHLIGFDHEYDGGEMREFEAVLRRKYKLPTGLIERESQ